MTNTAIGFGIASLLLPSLAFARIEITELMYDVPGTDEGREWVEVTNTGSIPERIEKYIFFENGTNHGLKLISGTSVLMPGTSAVIASDAAKFMLDHPEFSGALFDSAFSLSNKGESVSLKNASSSVLDEAIYTTVATTNGTGGSLHKSGATFVAAMPNPGIYPGTLVPVPEVQKSAPTQKNPTKNTTSSSKKDSAISEQSTAFISPGAASVAVSVPSIPYTMLLALGLAAVILLGSAGVLFARANITTKETKVLAEEFTIE